MSLTLGQPKSGAGWFLFRKVFAEPIHKVILTDVSTRDAIEISLQSYFKDRYSNIEHVSPSTIVPVVTRRIPTHLVDCRTESSQLHNTIYTSAQLMISWDIINNLQIHKAPIKIELDIIHSPLIRRASTSMQLYITHNPLIPRASRILELETISSLSAQ